MVDSALVTAIGSLSADIVIKTLKLMGMRVVGCDVYPKEWVVDASQVHVFYQAPYAISELEYIAFIQQICKKEHITLLLPSTDVEVDVLNRYREWFSENGITLCISEQKTIEICRNKSKTAKFITDNITRVCAIHTESAEQMQRIAKEYPIVCKPIDGRSSQGVKYIHSEAEWNCFTNLTDLSKYISQPYIEGTVVTVDIIRDIDGHCVAIPRKELLRTQNGAGTSVYVYHDRELEDSCREIAQALNVLGCVNFEFILDESGKYYFLECNPRLSGGVEFSCIAGYNCVRNHICAFRGQRIESFHLNHNYYISRKYEEYITSVE